MQNLGIRTRVVDDLMVVFEGDRRGVVFQDGSHINKRLLTKREVFNVKYRTEVFLYRLTLPGRGLY